MIPSVKLWRVTFTDGATREVWAPTKLLARLNVRHGGLGDYRSIRTVGLLCRRFSPNATDEQYRSK